MKHHYAPIKGYRRPSETTEGDDWIHETTSIPIHAKPRHPPATYVRPKPHWGCPMCVAIEAEIQHGKYDGPPEGYTKTCAMCKKAWQLPEAIYQIRREAARIGEEAGRNLRKIREQKVGDGKGKIYLP